MTLLIIWDLYQCDGRDTEGYKEKMGCGGGQNRKTVQAPREKDDLMSILPEGTESACSKKLQEPPSAPRPAPSPSDAVWKELSTNDESLSRKDAVMGTHKHVKSSKPFTDDLSARHKRKATKTEDLRGSELDQLIRDLD